MVVLKGSCVTRTEDRGNCWPTEWLVHRNLVFRNEIQGVVVNYKVWVATQVADIMAKSPVIG